jgi:hypothetical protein
MCPVPPHTYNGWMTSDTVPDSSVPDTSPDAGAQGTVGDALLWSLADGHFDQLAMMFEPDATLTALLPDGLHEWQGPARICEAFVGWFGRVDECTLLDGAVARHGPRLQMRWRARVRGGGFGDADFVVEQHAYVDPAPTGRIQQMSMLCSGFVKENPEP